MTYLFIDASREVVEGNKGDDSSDDEFPNEEQEVGHLVKNCHPYLGKDFFTGDNEAFWVLTIFLNIKPKACFADRQKLVP